MRTGIPPLSVIVGISEAGTNSPRVTFSQYFRLKVNAAVGTGGSAQADARSGSGPSALRSRGAFARSVRRRKPRVPTEAAERDAYEVALL